MLNLGELLQELREDRLRRRREATGPFHPLGPKAWERRRKRKEAEQKLREEKEFDKKQSRARAQQRYYQKNKNKLAAVRTIKARRPIEVYRRARRRAHNKGQGWEFASFDEWWDMWQSAPKVMDPDKGMLVEAWKMKGSNPATSTQMGRRDLDGPWSRDNCFIHYKGRELNGRGNDNQKSGGGT